MLIVKGDVVQEDKWSYRTCIRPCVNTEHIGKDDVRPILSSVEHATALGLTLNCTGDGKPHSFTARLTPGRKLAYLTRSVGSLERKFEPIDQRTSPLHLLVNEYYLAPGTRVIGEIPSISRDLKVEAWPGIIIRR